MRFQQPQFRKGGAGICTMSCAGQNMRRGNCYRRALNRLFKQEDARGWRLVHGFAFVGGMVPGAHAWLRLPDGRVWDPTDNAYMAAQSYKAARRGAPVREYTRRQAARLALKHGHVGPWYDEKTGWQAQYRFMRQNIPGYFVPRSGRKRKPRKAAKS
jgi:hypothetical protein